jgi:hypothetical protein
VGERAGWKRGTLPCPVGLLNAKGRRPAPPSPRKKSALLPCENRDFAASLFTNQEPTHMGNLKKKRRLKMNKHKRRKRSKASRHKKRLWG